MMTRTAMARCHQMHHCQGFAAVALCPAHGQRWPAWMTSRQCHQNLGADGCLALQAGLQTWTHPGATWAIRCGAEPQGGQSCCWLGLALEAIVQHSMTLTTLPRACMLTGR